MKVQDAINIETVGTVEHRRAHTLVNAGAIIQMLIGVYQDPLQAAIREMLQNGWDSHKVAGTQDTPMEVFLPTAMNPYFTLRDFGTGMTPENFDEHYHQLGYSNKSTDNALAGGFGIGRLAPLSYADTFIVKNYHKGSVHAYIIDRGGVTTMSSNVDSDLRDGFQVSFPVAEPDWAKLQTTILEYHCLSPINLQVYGMPLPKFELLETDNMSHVVFDRDSIADIGVRGSISISPKVEMGGVLYPYSSYYHTDFSAFNNSAVKVPVGSVEILPSRDRLVDSRANDKLMEAYTAAAQSDIVSAITEKLGDTIVGRASQLVTLQAGLPKPLRNRLWDALCKETTRLYTAQSWNGHKSFLMGETQFGKYTFRWGDFFQTNGTNIAILVKDRPNWYRKMQAAEMVRSQKNARVCIIVDKDEFETDPLHKELLQFAVNYSDIYDDVRALPTVSKSGGAAVTRWGYVLSLPKYRGREAIHTWERDMWSPIDLVKGEDAPCENPIYIVVKNKIPVRLREGVSYEVESAILRGAAKISALCNVDIYGFTESKIPEGAISLYDWVLNVYQKGNVTLGNNVVVDNVKAHLNGMGRGNNVLTDALLPYFVSQSTLNGNEETQLEHEKNKLWYDLFEAIREHLPELQRAKGTDTNDVLDVESKIIADIDKMFDDHPMLQYASVSYYGREEFTKTVRQYIEAISGRKLLD